jgi:hypothetical protein
VSDQILTIGGRQVFDDSSLESLDAFDNIVIGLEKRSSPECNSGFDVDHGDYITVSIVSTLPGARTSRKEHCFYIDVRTSDLVSRVKQLVSQKRQ